MRHQRFLISFLAGFLAWTLGNMVWGSRGAQAQAGLSAQLREQTQLLMSVKTEKEVLEQDFEALLRDPQRVRLAARSLGYYEPEEYRLAIFQNPNERAISARPVQKTKKQYQPQKSDENNFPLASWLGIGVFLLTLISLELGLQAPKINDSKGEKPIKEILDGAQTS